MQGCAPYYVLIFGSGRIVTVMHDSCKWGDVIARVALALTDTPETKREILVYALFRQKNRAR